MVHSIPGRIGFRAARQALLDALRTGEFAHEPREPGKNLLADGTITAEEVRAVVLRAQGTHYEEEPDERGGRSDIMVHILSKVIVGGNSWYIKWWRSERTVFVSVHYEMARKKH